MLRIKNLDDQASWREFFEAYWRFIYNVAIKSGLTDAEAQDVVQETVIAVSKRMPGYEYRPGKDSFKGWLMRITRWKIADQFRKRPPVDRPEEIRKTAFLERVPDPERSKLDSLWDDEWEKNLLKTALKRVKGQVNPKHYEIFIEHVIRDRPAREVAQSLAVTENLVYVVRSRVSEALKKEIKRLETKLI